MHLGEKPLLVARFHESMSTLIILSLNDPFEHHGGAAYIRDTVVNVFGMTWKASSGPMQKDFPWLVQFKGGSEAELRAAAEAVYELSPKDEKEAFNISKGAKPQNKR